MNWNVKIAKRASKQMKRISKKDVQYLLNALESLIEDPYWGDIEKISGETNTWRRRVGNYRILYEIFSNEKFVSVFDIRRRTTTAYRR